MMWEIKKFNDFIKLNRGFDLPNEKMINGEFPVVASTTIKGFHNQYKIKSPCVVTGRSGSLGIVQYITKDCWPLNTSLYVKDFKGNYPKYVYYYLQTMHLEMFNSGAGVPTLNQNHLHSIRLKTHNLATQQRIAGILSAYDDLIENNNRRIELLEQAAHQIYKEWFVRFRFPRHETAAFFKGIPAGWEIVKLGELAKINSKSISKEYKYDIINYIDISSVKQGSIIGKTSYVIDDAPGRAKRIIRDGDILWSMVRPNLRAYTLILHPEPNDVASTGFAVLTPTKVPFSFLYNTVTTDSFVEYLNNYARGSAYPAVTSSEFKNAKVLLPTSNLLNDYHTLTEPLYREMQILYNKNHNLIKQRDLLLPRLMSGKIEV